MKFDLSVLFAKGTEVGQKVPRDALMGVLDALSKVIGTLETEEAVLPMAIQSIKFEFGGSAFYPDLYSTIVVIDSREGGNHKPQELYHYQAFRTGQATPAPESLAEGILDEVAKALRFVRNKGAAKLGKKSDSLESGPKRDIFAGARAARDRCAAARGFAVKE